MFVKREPKVAPAPKAAAKARGTGFFGTQAGKMGASPSAFSLKGASNVKLSQGKQTLGRDSDDADIVLRGAAVSGVHAAITVKGSTCSVQVSVQLSSPLVPAEDSRRTKGAGLMPIEAGKVAEECWCWERSGAAGPSLVQRHLRQRQEGGLRQAGGG